MVPPEAPGRRSDPARSAIGELRWFTWGPILLASCLVALSLSAPQTALGLALPVAVVGALLGVPHGAVDHLVPGWWAATQSTGTPLSGDRATRPAGRRRLIRFGVGYVAVAGLALAALLLAPTPSLVLALLLSALHFGRGEVVTCAERAGRPTPSPWAGWPQTIAHGWVTVGLLLWARPELSDPYVRPLSPWVADAARQTRGPALVMVAVAVAVGSAALARRRQFLDAGELGLLTLMFAVAPPLAAFGLYFGCWHAVRHTGRLLDLARRHLAQRPLGPRQLDPGRLDRAFPQVRWSAASVLLARASVWPSVVALLVVLLLWSSRELAGLHAEMAVLLALTFPHAAVVWVLDRRQAVGVGAGRQNGRRDRRRPVSAHHPAGRVAGPPTGAGSR
jgi:Brp/Blh family beta-carotene 15,15'-monooxygenase